MTSQTRSLGLSICLLIPLLSAVASADRAIDREALFGFEKKFTGEATALWKQDPRLLFFLLPRAFYLENFGVITSAELNLAQGPVVFPFRGPITKEEITTHRDLVMGRVPQLRDFLRKQLLDSAAMFPALPDQQRLGIAVTVYHYSWEDTKEIPTQIVVQGVKKSLLEAHDSADLRARAVEIKETY